MAKTAVVNLVDLAGSERVDSTGATGDRLKEVFKEKSHFIIIALGSSWIAKDQLSLNPWNVKNGR